MSVATVVHLEAAGSSITQLLLLSCMGSSSGCVVLSTGSTGCSLMLEYPWVLFAPQGLFGLHSLAVAHAVGWL